MVQDFKFSIMYKNVQVGSRSGRIHKKLASRIRIRADHKEIFKGPQKLVAD
jgi:hypothetical protein